MAVPKRKVSRSNTRHRRSQWKAKAPDLVPVVVDGRRRLIPRRLIAAAKRGWCLERCLHCIRGQGPGV